MNEWDPACLREGLPSNADGSLACTFYEGFERSSCSCAADEGRKAASTTVVASIRADLKLRGECDGPGQAPCAKVCACEYLSKTPDAHGVALDADAVAACEHGAETVIAPVWCTIEDSTNPLLRHCALTHKRLLRFVGAAVNGRDITWPASGGTMFYRCDSTSLGTDVDAGS